MLSASPYGVYRWLFLLSFTALLAPTRSLAQFDSGPFQRGDRVQFQWGPHQVHGTVRASFGDSVIVDFEVDGERETSSLQVTNAQAYEQGQTLNKPRIAVGDFAQSRIDPELQGQVQSLNGTFATVLVPANGRSKKRTAILDELTKLDEVPDYAKPPSPSGNVQNTANSTEQPASSGSFRQWADSTGKHEIEAKYVAVRNGKVILEKSDGKKVSLPLSKLSATDQDFVNALDVRYVDFTPPSEMTAVTMAVSLHESAAVIGYGKGYQPPIQRLVIFNIDQSSARVVTTPDLRDGRCLAINDDASLLLTHHSKEVDFNPETKQLKLSYHLSIWDCSQPTARLVREFDASPATMFNAAAVWLDNQRLFHGQSDGKVRLWKVENQSVGVVYEDSLGSPGGMRIFGLSPNGKLFAVEDSRKDQIQIYTTHNGKMIRKVPTEVGAVEATVLTNSMLLGSTISGRTVAWNLKENKLFGQAQKRRGGRIHLGSGFAEVLPLSHQHALYLRKPFRVAQERAVFDFATAQIYNLNSPEVLTVGQSRRIWYPVDDGFGHHRLQSYAIPRELTEQINAPAFQK